MVYGNVFIRVQSEKDRILLIKSEMLSHIFKKVLEVINGGEH